MIASHPLDRPVWHALTTRQAALARGGTLALRLAAEYGPFAAAADASSGSLQALADLIPAGGSLWLVEADEMSLPLGAAVLRRGVLHQMVAAATVPVAAPIRIESLTEDDAPQMHALAQLTKPGPFRAATHQLGNFLGIKQDGALVAMAGERLQPAGFCEVSGVCTHPDHRGRGYARALSAAATQRILARGETPFLHVYPDNVGAIALYTALGFGLRRAVSLTIVARA